MRWDLLTGNYAALDIASVASQNKKFTLNTAHAEKTAKGFVIKTDLGGVEMRAEARIFEKYNAVDWVFYLKNTANRASALLSGICAADLTLPMGKDERLWHAGINGDTCNEYNFLPFKDVMYPGFHKEVEPRGGRPTDMSFPFFDICDREGGVVVGIGWSGQWKYTLTRTEESLHLTVGVSDAEFYLEAGEEVRLNRILVMGYAGNNEGAHVKFRRLMFEHFAPRAKDGNLPVLPCAIQDFDRYVWGHPTWASEEGQMKWIDCATKLKYIDTVWLDAAWFKGMFGCGVGNYSFRPTFPNGLRPNSDETRRRGMRYMLWFEPERISYGSEVDEEHPEWVIRDPAEPRVDLDKVRENPNSWGWTPSGLFNLGIPEAEKYLAGKIIDFIRTQGIDVYREDFNIEPLPFWRQMDTPGRKGMTEIKYIMGFYRFWDDIHDAFPGMLFDSCASGGRRNDLETMMRSAPLWRSDTGCSPMSETNKSDVWNQCQSMGLSCYLPLHAIAAWNTNAYEFRSAATNGIACQFDVFNENFDFDEGVKCLAEFERVREYWKGDFWPLTGCTLDETAWAAWQLNKPEQGAGMVQAFRRMNSPYEKGVFELKELDENAEYELTFSDEHRNITTKRLSGKSMMEGFEVEIPEKRASVLIEYRKV